MLFNSIGFLAFFTIIVAVYYRLDHSQRWKLLLAGSYYFYMCWRPAYIILIIISTLIDYYCGLGMGKASDNKKRKLYLILSLCSNLGLLFTFKYLNFFGWTVKCFLGYSQVEAAAPILNVLLPVGISFYTFQKLSYIIDVYRRNIAPEKRLGIFALYVSFFPQLVAGPIERSTRLIPQFDNRVKFNYNCVASGLKLMLWGMFKKVVIADNLSQFVEPVYSNPASFAGPSFVIATVFFAFQIYCDFSGYTDIAIGSARVLGFDLMKNFNRPYFARSITEFWRRWHISLSTWFRDYLYIPLGGNRVRPTRNYINLFIVFVLCGLWHGANWTFVIWGTLHGLYLVFEKLTSGRRASLAKNLSLEKIGPLLKVLQVLITFALVCFAWIFFRAKNLDDAWYIVTHLLSGWDSVLIAHDLQPVLILGSYKFFVTTLILIGLMETVHLIQRKGSVMEILNQKPIWLRWSVYYLLVIGIMLLGNFNSQEFIYFQF
ncbi:MBOAT family O-acyltransferase [Planctomycetota bacterium]